ncbi:hypothetical protein ACS0TY_014923 [Phlomoides rotata]
MDSNPDLNASLFDSNITLFDSNVTLFDSDCTLFDSDLNNTLFDSVKTVAARVASPTVSDGAAWPIDPIRY